MLIFLGCMLPVTIGAFNGARSTSKCWSGRRAAGERAACACCGRGGAERDTGAAQRHPHRARAVLHPAGQLRADVALKARLPIGFLGANGSYDAMFAVVLTVAFLGFAADRIYLLVMQRVLRWQN